MRYKGISPSGAIMKDIPRPTKNKPIVYEVLGIKKVADGKVAIPRAVTIPSIDRIYDYAKNVDDMIDIAYVTGELPSEADSQRDTVTKFGEITFSSLSKSGRIIITEDNYARLKNLHEFLWLSNLNESNAGKKYHRKPRKYRYRVLDVSAKKRVYKQDMDLKVDALAYIKSLVNKQIEELAYAIFNDYEYIKGDHEMMRARLYEMAEKNPMNVLEFQDENRVKTYRFIADLEAAGVIIWSSKFRGYVLTTSKQLMIPVEDVLNPKESAYSFFNTDIGQGRIVELKAYLEKATE